MTDLYEYQSKIVENPSETNVFVGARQTGKTTACVHAAQEWASEFDRVVYLTPAERMGKEVIERDDWENIENVEVRSSQGLDEDYFWGIDSQCVIVDEADYIDWSAIPDLDENFDRVFLAGTPSGNQSGKFYEFCTDSETNHAHASCFECPGINREILQEFQEDMTDTVFDREVCGIFV